MFDSFNWCEDAFPLTNTKRTLATKFVEMGYFSKFYIKKKKLLAGVRSRANGGVME